MALEEAPTVPNQFAVVQTETRKIRSFVRRKGRITRGQRKALSLFWQRYGLDPEPGAVLDLELIFGNRAPVWLEIGFGDGEALIATAQCSPEINFLGIDVHLPGVGHILKRISDEDLSNVRLICADAVEILQHHLKMQSLDRVLLFFPDPWPKRRHRKRRIVQPDFVRLIQSHLKPGGIFHMATDWENYALEAMDTIVSNQGFINLEADKSFSHRPDYRPLTKFEQRGLRLGHRVRDLLFQRL
jgi:tRNA (guanine-N7-)-methyltransferase